MSKIFLFAGASGAIARATASLLASKGHRVINISTKAGAVRLMNEPLDGLVYFPGTIHLKPFVRITPDEFLEDHWVNAMGAVSCVQKYLPLLKKPQNASIVFISSVADSVGTPFHRSHSPDTVENLARSLAVELAPAIRVNCVTPPLASTPLDEKLINTPDKTKQMQKSDPLRKAGSPAEAAAMISFLLSDESAWITGQVLAANDGMRVLKNG